MPRLARKVVGQSSFYAAVVTLVVFAAFPFYWMLITTFKTDGDLYDLKSIPYWFNAPPTLEHLKYLFEETLFVSWLSLCWWPCRRAMGWRACRAAAAKI